MGEKKDACRVLVRMPEGERLLGRFRFRWWNNFKKICDRKKVG
jgi:hypothetical protein